MLLDFDTDGDRKLTYDEFMVLFADWLGEPEEEEDDEDDNEKDADEDEDEKDEDEKGEDEKDEEEDDDTKPEPNPNVTNPIGECVLSEATGTVPDNLYTNTGIITTSSHQPFSKILTVRGITLMGRDEIEDDFMNSVASAIEEIFPENGAGIDAELQA